VRELTELAAARPTRVAAGRQALESLRQKRRNSCPALSVIDRAC